MLTTGDIWLEPIKGLNEKSWWIWNLNKKVGEINQDGNMKFFTFFNEEKEFYGGFELKQRILLAFSKKGARKGVFFKKLFNIDRQTHDQFGYPEKRCFYYGDLKLGQFEFAKYSPNEETIWKDSSSLEYMTPHGEFPFIFREKMDFVYLKNMKRDCFDEVYEFPYTWRVNIERLPKKKKMRKELKKFLKKYIEEASKVSKKWRSHNFRRLDVALEPSIPNEYDK